MRSLSHRHPCLRAGPVVKYGVCDLRGSEADVGIPIKWRNSMNLKECIHALFPYDDYTLPEGKYTVYVSGEEYQLECYEVVLIEYSKFKLNSDLIKLYNKLKKEKETQDRRLPYPQDDRILVMEKYFEDEIKNFATGNEELLKSIRIMVTHHYLICMNFSHIYNGDESGVTDYINKIRDTEGITKAQKKFFTVVEEFYKYVVILRAPWVDILEINYQRISGMFAYFQNEENVIITETIVYPFDYWSPTWEYLKKDVQEFFNRFRNVPLEDLFIARAKINERLGDYTSAIINAVISLEIVIPNFINIYLKTKGVSKEAILDFNNKFGLSVRVKAILKIILPKKHHHTIDSVGIAIKYRNRILHEGKTNEFFTGINVKELVEASEILINELKDEIQHLENANRSEQAGQRKGGPEG